MLNGSKIGFILMSIVNYSLIVIALMIGGYRAAIWHHSLIMITAQIILIILNTVAADSLKRHIILSVHLAISTVLAHFAYAFSYNDWVIGKGALDGESLLITLIACFIGLFLTATLSFCAFCIKSKIKE